MSPPLFARGFDSLVEGETFTTPGRTVTEADVTLFAALTGDRHRQHTDAAWAAGSPFRERIAHGLLVVSYAIGLIGFDSDHVIALRRLDRAVFKRPVCLGDTIHVEGRVNGLIPVDEGSGLVHCALRVVRGGDRTAVLLDAAVLWRRVPAGAQPSHERRADGPDFEPLPL